MACALQLSGISSGIALVQQEQQAAATASAGGCSDGEQRQLEELAGAAGALLQRGQQLLAAARQKARDALRYFGEDVPGEPAFSSTEPRRLLGEASDFLSLLHGAHGDSRRMAVCLAALRRQQQQPRQGEAGEEKAAGEAGQPAACQIQRHLTDH
jgi:hypothetical protein